MTVTSYPVWRTLRTSLLSSLLTSLLTCSALLLFVGCDGDDDSEKSSALDLSLPDAEPQCEVREGGCPNACEHGVGVLGERCADTDSCGCGLFCDEGRCAPYRGQHQGCLCEGGRAELPTFAESCTEATEGAACNDLNPCTLDDRCSAGICVGQPSAYPAACDDGNSCTSNDVCAGAVCQGEEKVDGSRCDDGERCTTADTCLAGICEGEPLNCEELEDQCNLGVCDPMSGECVARPKPAGEPCDDGDYCTLEDSCSGGLCVSSERVDCSPQETECLSARCDPLSGACLREAREDGLFCDGDGSACTHERCQDGRCVVDYTVRCDQLCNDGTCDPETGLCTGAPLADGTACDDQDACTENNTCRGGVCVIEALLCACDDRDEGELCDDGNPCTVESRCDASGACVAVGFEPEGVSCEVDGDLCTRGGVCDGAGSCEGEAPLDCEAALPELALEPCQVARCAPERGECVASPVVDGSACETGGRCDAAGQCAQGVCVAPPKDCHALDSACAEGVCDEVTGECAAQAFPAGTPCEDGDLCTGAARCEEGGAGEGSSCVPQTEVSLCDACVGLNEGDPCDDGDLCTAESSCVRRGVTLVCLGATRACASDESDDPVAACQTLICEPTTGECEPQDLPVGSPCDDEILCTQGDRCARDELGGLSCVGRDLQSEALECPEGASLLNPLALDQSAEDTGLVDQCADDETGQSAARPHSLDALSPSDPRAVILSRLSLERSADWFSLSLDKRAHVRAWVTDRCGRPAPFRVSLIHPSGVRDLTSLQRLETALDPSTLSFDVPQEGLYFIKVELARSLNPGERELPYVLHTLRATGASCEADLDCCAEERCQLSELEGEGGSSGLCQPLADREVEPNQSPEQATRLLLAGSTRARRTGALSDRSEEDWYKVQLIANHTYNISVEGYCGRVINTHLSLYDEPNGLPLMVNDDRTDARAEQLPQSPQLAGVIVEETMDVYLKVKLSPNAQDEPFGYYSITVNDVSCTPSGADAEPCACLAQRCLAIEGEANLGQCVPSFAEREPNQTLEEAQVASSELLLDTSFYGQIDRVGDRDVFLIDLPAGRFSLETSAYCEQVPANTSLKVMSLSGLTLARDDDGGEGRLSKIEEFQVGTSQRYLVEVSGEGGGLGPYLLKVSTLSLDEGGEEPETGVCEVDEDCSCADLRCATLEDERRACVPRIQELEPNERRLEATDFTLMERVTGSIDRIGDVDVYRVTVPVSELGEHLVFFLDPACDGVGVDASLKLLDQDGVTLLTSEAWRGGHMSATVPLEVTSAELYYLEVRGGVAARGGYILSSERVSPEVYVPLSERACYTDQQCLCEALRCDAAPNSEGQCVARGARELEPNDDPSEARALSFDALGVAQVTGALSGSEDIDRYLLNLGPDQQWRRFNLSVHDLCDQPAPPLTSLKVYDPYGALIVSREATQAGQLSVSHWTAHAQGSYTLVVSYAEGATPTEHSAYQLTFEPTPACDPSLEPESDPRGPCACAELECSEGAAGSAPLCTLSPSLSVEAEPNDLRTLATQLSVEGARFQGASVYGRIDQLADLDRYSFTFTPAQRGELFQVEVSSFCDQVELPLSRQVEQRGGGVLLLSESASGEPLSEAQRPTLGSGVFRVEGGISHLLSLTVAPLTEEPTPRTGEYRMTISPVLCQEDADCACAQVSCLEQRCSVSHDEGEGEGFSNDSLEQPSSLQRLTDRDDSAVMVGSGFFSPPEQGLPDYDHWSLPELSPAPGEPATVRVRLSPFCEAPLPESSLTLYNEAGELIELSPVIVEGESEERSYEATVSGQMTPTLRVYSEQGVGAYHLSVEVSPSTALAPVIEF